MEKLPEGWERCRLGDVVQYGKTTKAEMSSVADDVWILELEDIEKNTSKLLKRVTFAERASKSAKNIFNAGDVLYGKLRPYLNKVIIAQEDGICSSEIIPLSPDSRYVDKSYLFYWLKGQEFLSYVDAVSYGVNMPRLGTKDAVNAPFLLAPKETQTQIAEKLDDLLGQVATIQARFDQLPAIIKQFRQSVLVAAVTGNLTEASRCSLSAEIGLSPISVGPSKAKIPETWSWKKLTELTALESGHTPRKSIPEYWENGDQYWICLQDIRAAHGKVITDTKYKPTALGIDNSSARMLPKGTVCFSRDISVGFTTIMGKEMSTTQHFANWICGSALNNFYLMYAFMAAQHDLTIGGQGTTVKTIYMPALKEFYLATPPIEEQREIVEKVQSYFGMAEVLEASLRKAQEHVDNITQSILAKAFRGELVDQQEGDESAKVLLQKIAEARVEAELLEKATKKATRGRKTAKA